MDQKETLELYARTLAAMDAASSEGKDNDDALAAASAVWNGWASKMLAERKALEEGGTWAAVKDSSGHLVPHNDETRAWLDAARAVFSTGAFPHTFEEEFNCRGTGWIFPGEVLFDGATFTGSAWFGGATFAGDARFGAATFKSDVGFGGATFAGDAEFHRATFASIAGAGFERATFKGNVRFDGAKFTGNAYFGEAKFAGDMWFIGATFASRAAFDRVKCEGAAWLNGVTFIGEANFIGAEFKGDARFEGTTFEGGVVFGQAKFSAMAGFGAAMFNDIALFRVVRFDGYTSFEQARFAAGSDFQAISSSSAFSMEQTVFRQVPNFIQANFTQAPRLDNVDVRPMLAVPSHPSSRWLPAFSWPGRFFSGLVTRLTRGSDEIPARYRALKRLAIQGHDLEREQMFHAGEIRASRFATDWPLHYKLWSSEGWASIGRFWFGLFYQALSDFGRSWVRPAVAWALLLIISFAVYLGAHPELAKERAALIGTGGTIALVSAYATTTASAWSRDLPCVSGGEDVQPLPASVRRATSAVNEALHLAFANGAVLGDVGSPDTATRTYGCLYGLAPTNENERLSIVPYPGIVSTMSKVQKALSALLIFLFGLAVRNMLKLK